MIEPDFYALLEIPQSASVEKIKQSYRRLSRKYHPDLRPGDKAAEQMFKNITWAYDTLANPSKRQKYDSKWKPKPTESSNGQRESSSAKASANTRSSTNSSNARTHNSGFVKGENFTAAEVLYVSLKECLQGSTKEHKFAGPKDNPKNYRVKVEIVPTLKLRNKRVKGAGHVSKSGGENGDLIIPVKLKEHPVYKLKGADLMCTMRITEIEAILGTQITFRHLLGEPITVIVAPGSKSGATLTLRGKGAPRTSLSTNGNLIVKFKIVKAAVISPKARELMRALDAELYPRNIRSDFAKHVS